MTYLPRSGKIKTLRGFFEPEGKVYAAIGYAVYDDAPDSSSENVFNKAGDEMYRDKQHQKAARGYK